MPDSSVYDDFILPHARCRHHAGNLTDLPLQGVARNAACGDEVQLGGAVGEKGRIETMKCRATGCVISRAAASILCEHLMGRDVEAARSLSAQGMLELFRVPLLPRRKRCALLAWEAWQDLLHRFDEAAGRAAVE